MAKEGLGSILPIAIVGGLGYWLYSSGMLNSLFGSAAPAASTVPATPAVGTNPVPVTPVVPVTPDAPPVCSGAGVLASLLANVKRAQGANGANFGPGLPGTLTVDEWGYYMGQMCTGMPEQYKLNADALFPGMANRGGDLNWSAFEGYARQAGLSAYPSYRGRGRVLIGTRMVRRRAA